MKVVKLPYETEWGPNDDVWALALHHENNYREMPTITNNGVLFAGRLAVNLL